MKVCISEKYTSDSSPYLTWTTDGMCYGDTGCDNCTLHDEPDCDATEVFALTVARINKLPCVVDTDDYPELFI